MLKNMSIRNKLVVSNMLMVIVPVAIITAVILLTTLSITYFSTSKMSFDPSFGSYLLYKTQFNVSSDRLGAMDKKRIAPLRAGITKSGSGMEDRISDAVLGACANIQRDGSDIMILANDEIIYKTVEADVYEMVGAVIDICGKSLSDIKYIPPTTKADLRDNYPFGLFARPMKEMVRIHASSGTTGKPTVVGYTKHDLDLWSDCVARIAAAAGATDEDIVQISFGYGMFTGALGLHYGLEKLGATVVPNSSRNTEKALRFRHYRARCNSVICALYVRNGKRARLSDERLQASPRPVRLGGLHTRDENPD